MNAVVQWSEPVQWCRRVTSEGMIPKIESSVQGRTTSQVFGKQ